MKKFFECIFIVLLVIGPYKAYSIQEPAKSKIQNQIIGQWLYIGYTYQDEFHSPIDDSLELIFSFESNGSDDLIWRYKDSMGKCHRRGEYIIENSILIDKIVWVDPDNMNACGSDPDMQIGRITMTPVEIVGDRLLMKLELSGEPFVYTLQRLKR